MLNQVKWCALKKTGKSLNSNKDKMGKVTIGDKISILMEEQ